jgi:hypothetical protein
MLQFASVGACAWYCATFPVNFNPPPNRMRFAYWTTSAALFLSQGPELTAQSSVLSDRIPGRIRRAKSRAR